MPRPRKGKTFDYISGKRYDGMMGRCYREKDPSYQNYGGRGIKVHSSWIKDISTFRLWFLSELSRIDIDVSEFVLNSKDYHLDRIDVNGHYTPENCRLISPQENSRNKRASNNRTIISAEGEEIFI